jgi:Tfp pilus assembly protein PilX
MGQFRRQEGVAVVTAIVLMAIMLVMGATMLALVDAQTHQTSQERSAESSFDLAEATLSAGEFLLSHNWPQTVTAGSCDSQTISGTLDEPAATAPATLGTQVQRLLAQTYEGVAPSSSRWWVTVCDWAQTQYSSWDKSLLNGPGYDTSLLASPAAQPRKLWVRAESLVAGRHRAVVGLVQAGQVPIFPLGYSVVTGNMGAELATTVNNVLAGGLVGPLLGTHPVFEGGVVGLRCSLLDQDQLLADSEILGCLSGLFTTVSALSAPVSSLLNGTEYVHFESDSLLGDDKVASLRRQAETTCTYYALISCQASSVNSGASCGVTTATAGKVVFIEQVGDGSGYCVLNTSGNPSALALVIGSGGVRVTGGGRFTGVIYALRRKKATAGGADVRIQGGSKVRGGVFVDDNQSLTPKHGEVVVEPPGCLLGLLCGVLGNLLNSLDGSLPAVEYNENAVRGVSTFDNSSLVAGTFRTVTPSH